MSNSKFADLKKKFKQQQEEKKNNQGNKFKNNDVYPFWLMEEGQQAIVRILPDLNAEENPNPFPISIPLYQNKLQINGKERKIPSLQTWGEDDPIGELSQKYYEQGDKEKGKYYWRKKTDILRAYVIEDPLPPDEETGENAEGKVKTLLFSFQLMEALNTAIADDEIQDEPWDLKKGYNFKIVKTAQPGKDESGRKQYSYAIGSGFTRNPSDVSELGIELVDLKTLLPPKPSREKIERMLHAHLTGEDYNEEDTGSGDGDTATDTSSSKTETKVADTKAPIEKPKEKAPAPKVEAKQEETVTESESSTDDDDALIAQLMARRKNQQK